MTMERKDEIDSLLKDIDAEQRIIKALPPYSRTRDRKAWQTRAKHQKIIVEKIKRVELLHEEERIASVVDEFLESRPQIFKKECPICLEDVPIKQKDSVNLMVCCGGGICKDCMDTILAMGAEQVEKTLRYCPLCRGEYPSNDVKYAAGVKKLAKKGNPQAQHMLGTYYLFGQNSAISINKRLALKWLRAASEGGYPASPHSLALASNMHREGNCGLDQSEARSLFQQSADLGYKSSQENYASMAWWGESGEKNRAIALYYATLACSGGPKDIKENFSLAACLLGWLYLFGEGGVDRSLYLAQHYLQLSADGGHYRAFFQLASTMMIVARLQYDGNTSIPGHSPVPKALYWARKSVEHAIIEGGEEKLVHSSRVFIRDLEAVVQDHCANCQRGADTLPKNEKLKCCVRCRAAWYCSKGCQVKHWNDGHKIDCIKPKMKKANSDS